MASFSLRTLFARTAPGEDAAKRARTDTVLQLEAAECGAASLAMVLSHFGLRIPLEELRTSCGVSRDGSKASSILKAARSYGLEAKGLKAEPEHLRALKPPMIAFVHFCHFLVVEGIRNDRVYINDPAQGRRTISMDEFDEMFTGVVLTFKPEEHFTKADTRPSTLRSLYERTAGFRLAIVFVFLTSLALVIPGIITPIFTRVFVDEILIQSLDGWMAPLLIGMAVTALIRFALTEIQTWYLTRTETQLAIKGSRELFAHILDLPIPFFGARYAGEIAQRLDLNDSLSALLTGEVARAALNTITAIFFFAVMCAYSWKLALIVLCFSLVNISVFLTISRALTDGYQKIAIDRGKLVGVGISGLQDIETFKAAGSEDAFFARWAGLHANVINAAQSMGRLTTMAGVMPPLLTALSTAAILTLGGYEVMRGELTIGMLVAFQTLAASFSAPISALAGFGTSIQELKSHTQRIDDVLRHPTSKTGSNAANGHAPQTLPKGHVTLDNASFGYLPLEPPLIEDLTIDIEPGAQIALVGASGSGKSTVGRLIVGLFPPLAGEVLIDGVPLKSWPRSVLAASLAYVDQEIVLFEGTVRDNLTLWDTTVPEAQLMAAAQDAEIHEVIASRAGGYASFVEEGGRNFSGGQKQRLELARALALNPRILVLDEATSALDPVTEHKIMNNIRRRGCTLVIVAHRLSTIRDSDEIIVLERGVPVERGRHEALTALNGRYANLIEA